MEKRQRVPYPPGLPHPPKIRQKRGQVELDRDDYEMCLDSSPKISGSKK